MELRQIEIAGNFGYISTQPDQTGNYYLFVPSLKGSDFTQINLKIDSRITSQFKNADEFLTGLSRAIGWEAIDEAIKEDHPIKIEYIPPSSMQSQGLRVQRASSEIWISLDRKDLSEGDRYLLDRYWSPLEKVIQEKSKTPFSKSTHVLKDVERKEEKPAQKQSALKQVSYEHTVGGVVYGRESAKQYPMISKYIKNLEGHIASLEEHRDDLEAKEKNAEAERVQKQIKFLEERLECANRAVKENKISDMVDSNYFRHLLKATTKDAVGDRNKKDLDQFEYNQIYEDACDRFIPCLANCWQQHAQGEHSAQHVGVDFGPDHYWLRFAAFYDTRCGLLSLEEFTDKKTGQLLENGYLKKRGKELLGRLEEYYSGFNKENNPNHLACRASLNWVMDQICDDAKGGRREINVEKLKQFLMERKVIQETHMLSLLETQLGRLKPGEKILEWLHVSLLKPFEEWKSADQKENPGWTHNEKYEIQEMLWSFRRFRGAQIRFSDDVSSPRITYDDEGKPSSITFNMTLAPQGYKENPYDIKLQSYLVSSSVASGVKSTGHKNEEGARMQQKYNQEFFDYAESKIAMTESIEGLKQGYSSFASAEDISSAMILMGWAISGCCQSGKDRTGFWCSRLAQKIVMSFYNEKCPSNADPNIAKCLDANPLSGDRVTKKILKANTGATAIKVGVMKLPGEDSGKLIRMSHYATLAYEQSIKPTISKFLQSKSAKVETATQHAFPLVF